MTLGRANAVAYVEPGSGARYGGGGDERCFSDDDVTDISMGLSMPPLCCWWYAAAAAAEEFDGGGVGRFVDSQSGRIAAAIIIDIGGGTWCALTGDVRPTQTPDCEGGGGGVPAGERLLDVEAAVAAEVGYSPARTRRSRRQRAVGNSFDEIRASEKIKGREIRKINTITKAIFIVLCYFYIVMQILDN